MKIVMLGWELPPIYAGGIGMVCFDLLQELSTQGHQVTYLMPFGPDGFTSSTGAKVVIAEQAMPTIKHVTFKPVQTLISAYATADSYQTSYQAHQQQISQKPGTHRKQLYGPDLYSEVDIFAKRAYDLACELDFDVIHAHDWMTFPAAIALKDKTGKPLVVHVHNTIYDRYLGNSSQLERDIEFSGMDKADKVIAISQYVKQMIVDKYGIDPQKIEVVHNAPNTLLRKVPPKKPLQLGSDKIVLFTGRMTAQKGPEYFVRCAARVLEKRSDVKFVMGGTGDCFHKTVELASSLGIADKFLFTGFYTMDQAKSLYAGADCYLMPSVSEPFGLVPLEAMELGAPTIITKTSGCSEVLSHALKVDFWDIDQMANKVLAVLNYPCLKESLAHNGQLQVSKMNWSKPTSRCVDIYQQVCNSL
jgi:glycogen synthase